MILPVDNRDIDGEATKALRSLEPTKSGPDYDNTWQSDSIDHLSLLSNIQADRGTPMHFPRTHRSMR
jgi:hypothetical protein